MFKEVAAEAPSNIALIKYMGKIEGQAKNVPTNPSLSYTLGALRTRVEIVPAEHEAWEPLDRPGWITMSLGESGRERYLKHWRFLRAHFGLEGIFKIRSGNNFPSDCGLASSASSFAALTLAAHEMARAQNKSAYSMHELAELSRQGSGSSCRSLFAPWGYWDENGAKPLQLPLQALIHQVAIVDAGKKQVSSSEAHRRVLTSPLFNGRVERARDRLAQLIESLIAQRWAEAFELTWTEFWDMHALFETSRPVFGYLTGGSLAVLNTVRSFWQARGDGPLVTMDAGANVHLLYRHDQSELSEDLKRQLAPLAKMFCSPRERA